MDNGYDINRICIHKTGLSFFGAQDGVQDGVLIVGDDNGHLHWFYRTPLGDAQRREGLTIALDGAVIKELRERELEDRSEELDSFLSEFSPKEVC